MIFHENHLLADDSQQISYLILSKTRKDVAKFVVCCSCDWRFKGLLFICKYCLLITFANSLYPDILSGLICFQTVSLEKIFYMMLTVIISSSAACMQAGTLPDSVVCCLPLQIVWTQIRPNKMLGLIWIQTIYVPPSEGRGTYCFWCGSCHCPHPRSFISMH